MTREKNSIPLVLHHLTERLCVCLCLLKKLPPLTLFGFVSSWQTATTRTSSRSTPSLTTTWATPPTTTPGSGSPRGLKASARLLAMRSALPQIQNPTTRPWSPSTAQGARTHPRGSRRTRTLIPTPTRQGHARLWRDSPHSFDSRDKIRTRYYSHMYTCIEGKESAGVRLD